MEHDKADLEAIRTMLIRFRDERNWKQFHNLKNLIISLNLEAAELLELTQWKSDEELLRLSSTDAGFREQLADECADVLLYLLLVAGEGGIDLLKAAEDKIRKNAEKYPVDQSYGSAAKYTELKQRSRADKS
ncbi:nucleotide pyrophosphohydrolase [Noviherbaspirillum sp. CPCC 100848]|uniref:Nucleotide pyrophosphohydrolase n=1 Tax=Noviherbaspirillum album TaxID=3080276 RepID=A0ABU6JA91_9BURK|nr:nucleotide pyrophosphohydrolase [Noviherbaspirillum sp. CPCC 100848]MEC4720572.1 nucleotide pyrophosphohydrolase [Noviherbaspirillum sp. CPCC 100848]